MTNRVGTGTKKKIVNPFGRIKISNSYFPSYFILLLCLRTSNLVCARTCDIGFSTINTIYTLNIISLLIRFILCYTYTLKYK